MSRFEGESRTWGIAANIIRDRIRALPEFSQLRGFLVSRAILACWGKDVPAMRKLGGFSAVLESLIAELPASADTNVGSKLLPFTMRSELRAELPSMRADVQAWLANRGRVAS